MTLNSTCGRGRTDKVVPQGVVPIVHVFIDDSLAIVSVPLTVKRL